MDAKLEPPGTQNHQTKKRAFQKTSKTQPCKHELLSAFWTQHGTRCSWPERPQNTTIPKFLKMGPDPEHEALAHQNK